MLLEFYNCPFCRAPIKPSYSDCPDCGFNWIQCGKRGLSKRLKAYYKKHGLIDSSHLHQPASERWPIEPIKMDQEGR